MIAGLDIILKQAVFKIYNQAYSIGLDGIENSSI